VHVGKVVEVGIDEGEVFYVIKYGDGNMEDMSEREFNWKEY